jgi:hypothetical protein
MSGKSRRRGRRLSRGQRKKFGRVVAAPVVESAAPTAQKPASAPRAAAPAVTRAPAARMAVQAAPPDVSGELKRIGIVGGIVVVLLVAAYFVLPLF